MKIKTIEALLVAGLVVLTAMVVFAGTAAAEEEEDPYRVTIYGYITYPDGSGVHGAQVEITKELGLVGSGNWESVGVTTTNETGYYTMTSRWYYPLRGMVSYGETTVCIWMVRWLKRNIYLCVGH